MTGDRDDENVGIDTVLGAHRCPAAAQFDKVLKGLGGAVGGGGGLNDAKIGSGLQEALKVGTGNAVTQTGTVDGFLLNKAIKILMPKTLQNMEQPLRMVGYGPQIDDFVVGMNRAAEKAVPFAKEIFWDAIGQMSFEDARKILNGSNTAATDYFKSKTSKKLQTAFLPSVTDVMNQVGVNRQYNDLMGRYKDLPFSKSVTFDVNQYVTEKATDGIFYVVAQEEKKIRTNPAARVTDLLKDVFGSRK
ncbi:MAG: DUF4197 domain-containing protein [Candidatus Binatia bacterium]|nr:DUF4197 domain-containing protein [Candidatus Binatia bacterium]